MIFWQQLAIRAMRTLSLIPMISSLLLSSVFADIPIRRILVEGNQRIEADTVRSYMVFKQGQVYDAANVDASLKTLFATGLFADVTIRREDDTLVVAVAENPIINRVAFEGNKAIKDDTLDTEVQLKPRTVYTRAKVQADSQRIIELHRRAGRFSATVEPKVIQLPQNRIDLIFEINEGPVTGIGSINFIGNKVFSDGDLREVISTGVSAWWKFLSSADTYDPDRMTFDRELLRRHYLSSGYADFRVVSAVADLDRDGDTFYLTFTIEEGPQYRFGKSVVETEIDKISSEYLEGLVLTEEGEIYDAGLIDESVDALTFATGAEGYAFAEIRPRVKRDKENSIANITYRITEGQRVYVERINVNGNVRTLDKVVRREMRLSEGDAFNRSLLKKSEQSIRALGYFSSVEIVEEPGSIEDRTIIDVNVAEQSTGELSLGFGFSSANNAIADVSLSERNFMGRGQFLSLRFGLSSSQQSVDLRFTEPRFLDRDLAAGFDIFASETNPQSQNSFKNRTTGFGLRFGFPVSENASLTTRYSLRREQIRNTSVSTSSFIRPNSQIRSSVGYDYFTDQKDDPVEPASGWDLSFGQEFSGLGGNVKFLSSDLHARTYYTFYDEFLGSAKLRVQQIQGLFGDGLTVSDRFFIGGSQFRGFKRAGVGPRDLRTDDAIGARISAIASLESTFPNFLPEVLDVTTAVFTDFGVVGDSGEKDIYGRTAQGRLAARTVRDELGFRGTAGVSIYWKSPFGPVRIDLSNVYAQESYDKTETFRFSAGTRF